jgi:hypothetical protein
MSGTNTREAWIRAAAALGLDFARGEPPSGATHSVDLNGSVDGFPVEVKVRRTDKSAWTDFTIGVGGLPNGLTLRRRTVTRLSFLPRRGVKTGDPEWDSTMVVKASQPGSAQAFLTPARRAAITAAMQKKPRPGIRKNRIKVTHQGAVRDEQVITGTVRRLTGLVESLDLEPPLSSFMAAAPGSSRGAATAWSIAGWTMIAVAALTWIFGSGSEPVILVAISGAAILVALLAFTRARGT